MEPHYSLYGRQRMGKLGQQKVEVTCPSHESLLLFFTNCPENSSFNCLGINYTLVLYCFFSCGSTCSIIASCTKHKMPVLAVQKCFFIDLQDSISGSLKLRDLKEILFAHSTSTRLAYLLIALLITLQTEISADRSQAFFFLSKAAVLPQI